jgi:hypothetical protein
MPYFVKWPVLVFSKIKTAIKEQTERVVQIVNIARRKLLIDHHVSEIDFPITAQFML